MIATAVLAISAFAEAAHAFVAVDAWNTTASGAAGGRGAPLTLTWSIAGDGATVPNHGQSNLARLLDEQLGCGVCSGPLSDRPWFPVLAESFDRWSRLSGLTFQYEPHDDGAPLRDSPGVLGVRGDVRLAAASLNGIGGALAVSQFPDSGDIVLDADDAGRLTNPASDYRRLHNVLMHEIGHTLGLDHLESDDAAFLMEPGLELSFLGPQIDDIRGAHWLFGDRSEALGGDELLDLGQLKPGEVRALGSDANRDGAVQWEDEEFLSIHSREDVDSVRFSFASPALLTVALTPLGGVYRQSVDGGPLLKYDVSASNNLSFSLLAGAIEVARVNAAHVGGMESLSCFRLPRGDYSVAISGTRDAVQLYELELRVVEVGEPASVACCCLAWLGCFPLRRRKYAEDCMSWLVDPARPLASRNWRLALTLLSHCPTTLRSSTAGVSPAA